MAQAEARGAQRASATFQVKLRSPRGDARVRILNLSEGGVMIDGVAVFAIGDAISLKLPNIGWTRGHVAWSVEERCGLAFDAAIDPQEVFGETAPGRRVKELA